ncbi:hypothetical protein ACFV6F_14990 [Kitasatospora phosalacinea]|uniref:hypothetical protein n=1 Tax=Kitasatospora phosalacinea TaxID=2065 RepID=UPI003667A6A1
MRKTSAMLAALTTATALVVAGAVTGTAQASTATPKCGVHPTQYLRPGNEAQTFTAQLPNVKGLDLTLVVTLRGGYAKPDGEVTAMKATTTIRTTDPVDAKFLDTSYYGNWEVDTQRTGTGVLWFQDADGRWISGSPSCGNDTAVEGFTGRVAVRDVSGVIDVVGFNARRTGTAALPW